MVVITRKSKAGKSNPINLRNVNAALENGITNNAAPPLDIPVGGGSQNLLGHGSQNTHKFTFPQDFPTFDGKTKSWAKFLSELKFHIKEMFGIDITSTPKPENLSDKNNEYIYQCLCRCVDNDSYELICNYENEGYEAFQFLDTCIGGSIAQRTTKVINDQATLVFGEHDDIIKYTGTLSRLAKDGFKYGVGDRKVNGSFPTLLTRSITHLPKRFEEWSHTTLERWQERGIYPTVQRYIDMLISQNNRLKESSNRNSSVGVSNLQLTNYNAGGSGLSRNQRRKLKIKALKAQNFNSGATNNGRSGNINNSSAVDLYTASAQFFQTQGHRGRGAQRGGRRNRGQGRMNGQTTTTATGTTRASTGGRDNKRYGHITCTRCLSTNGSHTAQYCKSNRHCDNCNNFSHETKYCTRFSSGR